MYANYKRDFQKLSWMNHMVRYLPYIALTCYLCFYLNLKIWYYKEIWKKFCLFHCAYAQYVSKQPKLKIYKLSKQVIMKFLIVYNNIRLNWNTERPRYFVICKLFNIISLECHRIQLFLSVILSIVTLNVVHYLVC